MKPIAAVMGMGFRFPGGIETAAQLWTALDSGADLVGPPSRERANLMPESQQEYPERAGYLTRVDTFDAAFFGIKGVEAVHMDPAQRMLLETTWWAFEDALLPPDQLAGSDTGVFVGAHAFDYRELCLAAGGEINAYWNLGLNGAVLANRLSWTLDLTGPSETVNTACSSGLAALDAAVAALERGRCSYALAAGVNLILTPTITISAARAGMLAPAGVCRTFDAGADGFVRGEGVCVLLLARPNKVTPEREPHAWITASRTGHGGHANSLTTPNLNRMRDLLVETWREAGLCSSDLGYLETHGTGTRLGDAVEVDSLTEASAAMDDEAGDCQLGSLKTNFGHLEAAAGLAGVIKVCLAMAHGRRPGLVHLESPNPMIDLSQTPFHISAQTTSWPQPTSPHRHAGVSSFGFGGSLAHVVLSREVKPATHPPTHDGPLILSDFGPHPGRPRGTGPVPA